MKLKKVGRAITLYSGEQVRVDEEDYEKLNQHTWYLFKSEKWEYAIRTEYKDGVQKTIFMHREIMGVDDPKIYVDHRDSDGLNNLKSNLRVSDNRFNQYNVGKKSTSKQKYKNIRHLGDDRYQIRMRTPEGVRIHKNVRGEEEAVKLYNELALKYHGEFAYLQEYRPFSESGVSVANHEAKRSEVDSEN